MKCVFKVSVGLLKLRNGVFGKILARHLGPYSNISTWVVSGEVIAEWE